MAGCSQTHHVLQWTRVVYHLESVSIRAETALLLRRSREIVIQNADQSHIFVAIAYLIINEHTTFSSGLFYLSSFRSKTYNRVPRPKRLRPQRHGFLAAPKIFQGKAWISRNSCDTKGSIMKCKFFGQWREGNNHLHS